MFDEKEFHSRKISPKLRAFIRETNASTPNKCRIMIDKHERVFGKVLSFNKNEIAIDQVYSALTTIDNKRFMPFAIDPFGYYYCLKQYDVVVSWEHEKNEIISTKMTLDDFLGSLY